MGSFTRSGRFQDRAKFVAALREKLAKLKDGAMRGLSETWEEGPVTTATLSGFGARLAFTVGAGDWKCEAELPLWLPIAQSTIEEKFDRELEDLKGL